MVILNSNNIITEIFNKNLCNKNKKYIDLRKILNRPEIILTGKTNKNFINLIKEIR